MNRLVQMKKPKIVRAQERIQSDSETKNVKQQPITNIEEQEAAGNREEEGGESEDEEELKAKVEATEEQDETGESRDSRDNQETDQLHEGVGLYS